MYRNPWLLGILLISTFDHSLYSLLSLALVIAGQILIIFVGGPAFETTPISWQYWLISVIIGACSLAVGFLARLLPIDPFLERVLIWMKVMPAKGQLPTTKESSKNDVNQLKGTLARESSPRVLVLKLTVLSEDSHPTRTQWKN